MILLMERKQSHLDARDVKNNKKKNRKEVHNSDVFCMSVYLRMRFLNRFQNSCLVLV